MLRSPAGATMITLRAHTLLALLTAGCRCGGVTEPSSPEQPASEPSTAESAPPDQRQCHDDLDSHCFVRVPGGTFLMGAQATDPKAPGHDPDALPEEAPVHEVTLGPYWISRDEFGLSAYGACLDAGACLTEDAATGGYSNRGSGRNDHPINAITWEGARRACAWLGGRLPTEAEWELAARGLDGRRWPWGSTPGCGVALDRHSPEAQGRDPGADSTMRTDVCSMDGTSPNNDTRGRSPWGVRALAGSVWEWVEDAYAPYPEGAVSDPRGPSEGDQRVIRGGGWTSETPAELRATVRAGMSPDEQVSDVGFRCVWGAR
jgi:formylglycine-generating enzyme required for sulfatase activity